VKAKTPPKKARLTRGLALSADLNAAANAHCRNRDMNFSQWVRSLIKRELDEACKG
jgi:hypothetical protein